MENLIFSLNATVPVFLLIVFGWCFRRIGWMDETFAKQANRFVFKVALPVVLFRDVASAKVYEVWDTKFVIFCFLATLFGILVASLLSLFLKDKTLRGEFIQACYRGSSSLLGIAFVTNVYGSVTMTPLMIIGSVPLYNVMGAIVLSVTRPDNDRLEDGLVKRTVKDIMTNPIIMGVLGGMMWSLLKLPYPPIMSKSLSYLAAVATPLGLMSMGATFDPGKVKEKLLPTLSAGFIKLILLPALILPVAVIMGFRGEQLMAVLVMMGSASTISCFVIAKNMGHEGILSSGAVALTTCGCGFSFTMWLYLLKTLNLL